MSLLIDLAAEAEKAQRTLDVQPAGMSSKSHRQRLSIGRLSLFKQGEHSIDKWFIPILLSTSAMKDHAIHLGR
jgi:hypothetical protein